MNLDKRSGQASWECHGVWVAIIGLRVTAETRKPPKSAGKDDREIEARKHRTGREFALEGWKTTGNPKIWTTFLTTDLRGTLDGLEFDRCENQSRPSDVRCEEMGHFHH